MPRVLLCTKESFAQIKYGFLVLCCSIVLAACESENDGGEFDPLSAETIPPEITSIEPEGDDGELIETDAPISIEFDELIDIDSVLDGGVTLATRDVSQFVSTFGNEDRPLIIMDDYSLTVEEIVVRGTNQNLGIEIEQLATKLVITPEEQELALGSVYELRIEPTVKDLSANETKNPITGDDTTGNFLLEVEPRLFGTELGAWQTETREELPGTLDIQDLNFASTFDDRAHVFWHEFNAATSEASLFSLAFDILTPNFRGHEPSSTDNSPTEIAQATGTSGPIINISATSLGARELGVAWQQVNVATTNRALYFNYYDPIPVDPDVSDDPAGWLTEAVQLSTDNNVIDHRIDALPNGQFLIVWIENNAGTQQILLNTLDPNDLSAPFDRLAWLASAEVVVSSATESLSNLDIATSEGQTHAISWEQSLSGIRSVNAVIYNTVFGLRLASLFQSSSPDAIDRDSFNASMALSTSSDGYIAWQQFDGTRYNIWRSRIVGETISDQELVETNNFVNSTGPKVAVCRNGLASILWNQSDGISNNVYVSSTPIEAELGWSTPEELGVADEIINDVKIEAEYDLSCNLNAVWSDSLAARSLGSAQFNVIDKTWSTAIVIGESGSASTDFNSVNLIPLRSGGRFMAAYRRLFEDRFSLFFNLYNDSND